MSMECKRISNLTDPQSISDCVQLLNRSRNSMWDKTLITIVETFFLSKQKIGSFFVSVLRSEI